MGCSEYIRQEMEADDSSMLVIQVSGSLPDGLVALCEAWGVVD